MEMYDGYLLGDFPLLAIPNNPFKNILKNTFVLCA